MSNQVIDQGLEALPPILTTQQVKDFLGSAVGWHGLREAIRTGELRSLRLGRKIVIPRSAVAEWLDGLAQGRR